MKSIKSLFLIFVFTSCFSTNKFSERFVEINEEVSNVHFLPKLIEKEITKDFFLEIIPIDAKEMNFICYEKTLFGGDYSKEKSVITLIDEELNNPKLSQGEIFRLNNKKQRINFINDKIKSHEIPDLVGNSLIKKLLYINEGTDGVESKGGTEWPSTYNPYKIGGRYLSVFKLRFKNQTDKVKTFKSENLVFHSGEEQLKPYTMNYYEDIFSMNVELLKILYRINLPDDFSVPPGQIVTKYIATPSLNTNIPSLVISVLPHDLYSNFEYSVSTIKENLSTRLRQIHFVAENEFKLGLIKYYFVIFTENDQVIILKDNSIFLSNELLEQKIDVYCLASVENGFAFDKIIDLKINDHTKNVFTLKFSEIIDHNY